MKKHLSSIGIHIVSKPNGNQPGVSVNSSTMVTRIKEKKKKSSKLITDEKHRKCTMHNYYQNYYVEFRTVTTSSTMGVFFKLYKQVLGKEMLFGAVYLEPEGSPYVTRQAFLEIEEAVFYLDIDNVCLLGDFNARTG